MILCRKCSSPVDADTEGLNQKLISRSTREFFCIRCLASHFETTEEKLRILADHYREAGCLLFPKKEKKN